MIDTNAKQFAKNEPKPFADDRRVEVIEITAEMMDAALKYVSDNWDYDTAEPSTQQLIGIYVAMEWAKRSASDRGDANS